ncbi:transcription initiation factor TFIID subunit 13, partial [Lecanoromycetidae sp. Uapishka_2]
MTEPRARAARHKGQMNFQQELKQMLYAFGDDHDPLDETVRVLDEIVTDFIIETSHTAAKAAEVSGRTKLKIDDFKFAIRKDELSTGRVKELFAADKTLKASRQVLDPAEGRVGLERGGRKKRTEDLGFDIGGMEKEEKAKGEEVPREVADDEELGDEDDIHE